MEGEFALSIDEPLQVACGIALKAQFESESWTFCIAAFLLFHSAHPIPDNINLLHLQCLNIFISFMREHASAAQTPILAIAPDYKFIKGREIKVIFFAKFVLDFCLLLHYLASQAGKSGKEGLFVFTPAAG